MTNMMQAFANAVPGGAPTLGGSMGGGLDGFDDLKKALQASNYETDVSTLTGGGSLTVQSLDNTMKTVVQEESHFVLFNKLQQTSATNIVDEYVRQNSVGGFLGGSVNTQMGVVNSATGDYSREVGLVKFLMTLRQVAYVLGIGKNIAEPTAIEERNGALQLLTDAEYLLLHGNSAVAPAQFDGFFTQIENEYIAGRLDGDHIIDMQAAPIDSVEPFTKLQAAVKRYGSWGSLTDALLTVGVQADLNMSIDPAYRWSPDGNNNPLLGSHVDAIRLSGGRLDVKEDTFLIDGDFPMGKPFEVTWPAVAAANSAFKPASLTVNAASSDAASQFTAARAGNYYYAVAAIDGTGKGNSEIVISTQTAVAAGKKAVLTITKSSANTETGYAIYRSKLDGDGAVAEDFRLVRVVPKAGNTTTYTDLNRDIPGTVSIPCMNMSPTADAIGWRQYQPMTKIMRSFGTDATMSYSWFQCLFGYLRITKPKHHGYIKNVLPTTATWRPFPNEAI